MVTDIIILSGYVSGFPQVLPLNKKNNNIISILLYGITYFNLIELCALYYEQCQQDATQSTVERLKLQLSENAR